MLRDPLPDLPGQVEPGERRVAVLEVLDDPEGLAVVIEPAVIGEALGQDVLAEMPERRVPEVVRERQGLDQVLVQTERARDRPPDLADLDAVGQPGPEVVALVIDEHLRLVLEPPERPAMDDPVAVALVRAAVTVLGLGDATPAGAAGALGVRGQPGVEIVGGHGRRVAEPRAPRQAARPGRQTLKLWPHPQVPVAFGFSILKPDSTSPST